MARGLGEGYTRLFNQMVDFGIPVEDAFERTSELKDARESLDEDDFADFWDEWYNDMLDEYDWDIDSDYEKPA